LLSQQLHGYLQRGQLDARASVAPADGDSLIAWRTPPGPAHSIIRFSAIYEAE
jgi:hypothetical protein